MSLETDKILKQIDKTKAKFVALNKQLRDVCIHEDIEYKSECTDDWALPKLYQETYRCKICGLYVCSPEYHNNKDQLVVSNTFEKLYKLYWTNNSKSTYRIENFDKHYLVKEDI